MSSYAVKGLTTGSDAQVVPIIEVKRGGNSFIGFKEVSRCYKTKIIAVVAVAYLVVVFIIFSHLLYQQAVGVDEPEGQTKFVWRVMPVKTAGEAAEDMNVVRISNKSNVESKVSDKEMYNDTNEHHLSVKQVKFLYSADPNSFGLPNYCVHVFYYPWYGTPTYDGQYYHWNHRYLPHWHQAVTNQYPKGRHKPPDDIGASFYPQLGCYSSKDHRIIQMHMKMLRQAGVGVLAVSWFPPDQHDDEGKPLDEVLPLLLDIAKNFALKIALHLEPYKNRSAHSVYNDIKYIHSNYGTHPALYKMLARAESPTALPVVYIYDSYQVPPLDWAKVFTTDGSLSLRNTVNDVIAIGLVTSAATKLDIITSGFDGFYTYFASDGFTYGSTSHNWNPLSRFANEHNLLFVPSAGPGYDDTKVRPWNSQNTQSRSGGRYYREKMSAGIEAGTKLLSITSFNEWHEGTQIEPAIPTALTGITYQDYRPHRPDYYLDETRRLLEKFKCDVSL